MSHYTVAVITDKIENLESMLAPYNERLKVAPYISETKEELILKGKERKEGVLKRREEGKELDDWDLKYLNCNTDEEFYNAVIYEDETYDEQRKFIKYI